MNVTRREFLEISAATTTGLALSKKTLAAQGKKSLNIGIVGTGRRGKSLLKTMLQIDNINVPALCDIDQDALSIAQDIAVKAGHPKPQGYSKDEYVFKELMNRDDLDAVIIATPWHWHTPMAVYGMERGKYVGVEVPAALSLDECWQLVNTHEKTGVPCMMLENWSFRRDNLAILNMIRKGMFGDIVHCHCAHSHDCVDHWFFDTDGKIRWGGEYLVKYNRDQYPTHSLGPVLSWMDINCGDSFDYLTSTASDSRG
ncbi:MAG: Gfo/Idh/MocA family oxidoreductase, partial [Calditrichaeota bacterium]|nr:Gfo/Idh/MocA family oxidoreductase [Calditrichota bacterium]